MKLLAKEMEKLKKWSWPRFSGRVTQVIGMLIESKGPEASIGEVCYVFGKNGKKIPCQVVGFKEEKVLLMALSEMSQIASGAEVFPKDEVHQVGVAPALCGRILDALGEPIDGKGPIEFETFYPVSSPPPSALERQRITEKLVTGIKAIDGFLTLGRGQRIGIFSEAGVGKSTLMGMLANRSEADINVIALIGERGREVREFIEKDLGKEGLSRSCVIVTTSDQMATLRCKGAQVATAIAEYFRDQRKNVMLMMDSVSRFAMALREIGLAIGEPPTTRGYPPSVFAYLPALLERAGNSDRGSITGVYTILEEKENNDPIAEHMRSLLDGHISLSKKLSIANHFPPIDILNSLSRVMTDVASPEHVRQASRIRDLLQAYKEAEELIEVGAYVPGTNPKVDIAKKKMEEIELFLRQNSHTFHPFKDTLHELCQVSS